MRWRVLFVVSLAANVALGAAWLLLSHRYTAMQDSALAKESQPIVIRTNLLVRRQFITWSQIESTNYSTYIANLRAIQCPEQTIRDIIIADVNALYARKLATEVITPQQQWWRSKPSPKVIQAAADKIQALEDQRRALLTQLLGTNWESGDLANLPRPTHSAVALDGPVLGVLPPKTKQQVQEVNTHAQERLQAYLDAQKAQGKDPDPVELAKLRQQTRDELAHVLTPPQLEEYLLRYSQNANELRNQLGQLKYFDASSNEFRALFEATDAIDQQLQLLADSHDPSSVAQRQALERERDNAIKTALGPDRYAEYKLLQDPAYRAAVAAARAAGDPDAAQTLYEINVATAQQEAAVRADTNLTDIQRAIQLKQIELDQLHANAQALGQEAGPPPPTEAAPSPPIRSHPYVLGAGETAATVAMLFGVPLKAIQKANPNVNLNHLRPGDTIQVPDSLPGH